MTSNVTVALCYAGPILAGVLGAVSTSSSVKTWYRDLRKPSFTPPNWLFGPVWTTLYIAMGYASHRVIARLPAASISSSSSPSIASTLMSPMVLYGLQLALNATWSPVFFGMRQIGGALVNIVALDVLVIATMRSFWTVDRVAGALFVPYLLWASFATALNYQIWRLNGTQTTAKRD